MPRYFFHLIDVDRVDDEEGRELADLGAAMRKAQAKARAIMANEVVWRGRTPADECIEIADENGAIVMLAFHDLVSVPLRVTRHSSIS